MNYISKDHAFSLARGTIPANAEACWCFTADQIHSLCNTAIGLYLLQQASPGKTELTPEAAKAVVTNLGQLKQLIVDHESMSIATAHGRNHTVNSQNLLSNRTAIITAALSLYRPDTTNSTKEPL